MRKPIIKPVTTGKSLKTLHIIGKQNAEMPLHTSTAEAVIIVTKGTALLTMEGKEILLNIENPITIPKNIPHSLELISDFEAYGIFPSSSEIKFI